MIIATKAKENAQHFLCALMSSPGKYLHKSNLTAGDAVAQRKMQKVFVRYLPSAFPRLCG